MNEPTKAVFLSYAREDSETARHIAEALRAFGVEVWFDQNELRGGDSWDAKIRNQIKTCALFIPLVSQRTEERSEGYFRREWKLAIDRTHDMSGDRAFIVPVVIDETREAEAAVPEEFMRYQWTRLANGTPTPEFVSQVKRLLDAPKKPTAATSKTSPATAHSRAPVPVDSPASRWPLVFGTVAVAAIGSFFTAASFLKLGHAAFKGEYKAPAGDVKEAPWSMLAPMVIIAALCVFFGLGNALPIDGLIVPAVGKHFADAKEVSGWLPHQWGLVAATVVVLTLAVLNHRWGVKRAGTGLGAVDHIHHAPVAHQLYDAAEKRRFDPYEIALWFVNAVAELAFMADRAIDAIYDKLATACARISSLKLSKLHDGSHATYMAWSVVGAAVVVFYIVGGF
jgi:hypothetical protein